MVTSVWCMQQDLLDFIAGTLAAFVDTEDHSLKAHSGGVREAGFASRSLLSRLLSNLALSSIGQRASKLKMRYCDSTLDCTRELCSHNTDKLDFEVILELRIDQSSLSASFLGQVGKDIVQQFQDAISRSGHQIVISPLVQLTFWNLLFLHVHVLRVANRNYLIRAYTNTLS